MLITGRNDSTLRYRPITSSPYTTEALVRKIRRPNCIEKIWYPCRLPNNPLPINHYHHHASQKRNPSTHCANLKVALALSTRVLQCVSYAALPCRVRQFPTCLAHLASYAAIPIQTRATTPLYGQYTQAYMCASGSLEQWNDTKAMLIHSFEALQWREHRNFGRSYVIICYAFLAPPSKCFRLK